MVLRRCKFSDLQRIQEIEGICFTRPYTYEMFLEMLLTFPEGFIVSEEQLEVVGYIIFKMIGSKGLVSSICVLPDFKNKGIGQEMLDYAIDFLVRRVEYIELQVGVSNEAAKALYLKNGFRIVGLIRDYYWSGEDAYVMKRMSSILN